jgi:hypothetical protein
LTTKDKNSSAYALRYTIYKDTLMILLYVGLHTKKSHTLQPNIMNLRAPSCVKREKERIDVPHFSLVGIVSDRSSFF